MASEEPCNVLARFLKDRLDLGKPIQLRVSKYFPRVPTFEYNEDGTVDKGSLMGPARIEAKEQLVREKMVAVEETRMLKEALGLCFRREGVNSAEHCKPLVEAYAAKLSTPHYGMLNVSDPACCPAIPVLAMFPLHGWAAGGGQQARPGGTGAATRSSADRTVCCSFCPALAFLLARAAPLGRPSPLRPRCSYLVSVLPPSIFPPLSRSRRRAAERCAFALFLCPFPAPRRLGDACLAPAAFHSPSAALSCLPQL